MFGEVRRYIAGSVLNASYRYFWDDWGITSQTADNLMAEPKEKMPAGLSCFA